MEEFLSPRDACKIVGVSYITLWRWIREGRVRAVRSPSGRYLIPRSEIERLRGEEKRVERIRAVIYARVSSSKQKEQGDLDRQVELLKKYADERGYTVVDVITDVGSGLEEERGGLKRLLKMVADKRVDVVLIMYRDRLTRFGYEYLQFFFERHGVRIEEVLQEEEEPLEELIEDFLAIIASFAGKIYGKRSRKVKKLVEHNKRFLQETLPVNIEEILEEKQ
ncbi:IS607 family transposase [Vulcanisaeta sp. JCM 14467]|uniref:IS607 family transposase n=1 Tax=Vulcanisaeta sp. JCM 14467 TaxID=1295370 RepID=UPI0006CFB32D|nr:IS607 family transposase [Vulcanisaeta sp. JCM 14467]